MDQTAAALSNSSWSSKKIRVINREKAILRELAGKVAELAAGTVENEKRDLWYRHNDLYQERPLVFCDPENGWNEIITDSDLKCESDIARTWEMSLRKEIFWGEYMKDDRVIEPYFNIPYVANESDWGMHEEKTGGHDGGSYRWEAPLKDYKDLTKLHFPEISIDYEGTQQIFDIAGEIFNDLLQVRIKGVWWWTLGMTWTLVNLRGLEQIMLDMYDYPEELHKLMTLLRDGHLYKLDFLEKNGLLSLNNEGTYVGSGGFGWTRQLPADGYNQKHVRTKDMWGFAESQETSQISPDMFEEFVFRYQLPILERFGLNCYGCCEDLGKRWDIIKKIPGLRRVSVSPWANIKEMAEKLTNKYIFSYKPNPAYLAVKNIDEEFIRKSLREVLKTAHGCNVEIIMKDNHTLAGNPQNAIRWCRIAQEEASSC